MVCRGPLLKLHRAGGIELPGVRQISLNPFLRRERPQAMRMDTTPLIGSLDQIRTVELAQARRTAAEPLFNSLIEHHHYLGYKQPVGEHLRSSAPRHIASRDRFIGWSADERRRNIRFLAYNTRFLILPWVQVPHLASHILGRVTQQLSRDWERLYGHAVYFAQTFIDPGRFRATCYRAANWKLLGLTTGRARLPTASARTGR